MGNAISNCYNNFYRYDNVYEAVVTGAEGKLGHAVIESLINDVAMRGHVLNVHAAAAHPDELAASRSFSARTERKLSSTLLCDPENAATLGDCFANKDVAVVIPPTTSDVGTGRRAELTLNMVDAAYRAGVQFVVVPSALSVRVDGEDRSTALAREYGDLEDQVRSIGVSSCLVRLPPFMEMLLASGQATSIRQSGTFSYPMSPHTRLTDLSIADAGVLIASIVSRKHLHENAVYNISGSEAVSNAELADILSNVLGREIRYVEAESDEQARQAFDASGGGGGDSWDATAMTELCKLAERGNYDIHSNDFAHVVGREPETKQEWTMRVAPQLSDRADGLGSA